VKKLGNNIEVVSADVQNLESNLKALEGIEKVFVMTPPMQTQASLVILEAIKKTPTVKSVVKLSAYGAEQTGGKFVWAEEHQVMEDAFSAAGVPLTSIRPTSFHSNIYHDLHSIKTNAPLYKPFGSSKINFVSNKDIGEVAAKALTEAGHEGKIYKLTGNVSDNLSWPEITNLINEVLGKNITYVTISMEDCKKAVSNFLPNAEAVNGMINMFEYFSNGGYDYTNDEIEKLLGRKPTTLRQFLEENKEKLI